MKKTIQLFFLFGYLSIKGLLQQPLSVCILFLGKAIRFGMLFFFLYYLVSQTKILAGYTVIQTIMVFLIFNFIDTLGQMLFRETYRFKPFIISGEFDTILVKPYHPFLRILTGGVDLMDIMMLVPYILLIIYFTFKLSPSFSHVLLFSLLVMNSLLIITAFHIIILSIGIVTTEVENLINIFRDLSRLAMVPVDIYQEPLRFLITFIIPIGVMMTVPAKALFGLISVPIYVISVCIAGSMLGIAYISWQYALKKYQSWGG